MAKEKTKLDSQSDMRRKHTKTNTTNKSLNRQKDKEKEGQADELDMAFSRAEKNKTINKERIK